MNKFITFLIAATLSGCSGFQNEVPPEAVVAIQTLDRASSANAQTRTRLFDTLAKNMRAMHESQLDLIMQKELAAASVSGSVPIEKVNELVRQRETTRTRFESDLATERIKWLNDPNLQIEAQMISALNGYIKSIDDFARELEVLMDKLGMLKPEEPPAMPSDFPTPVAVEGGAP